MEQMYQDALRRSPIKKAGEGSPLVFQDMKLTIDRPAGFVQTGVAADGTAWERTYLVDYGFIDGALGGDGEGLDVFIGPDPELTTAYWITQNKAGGEFDEFKVMLGYASQALALKSYLDHVPLEFFGGIAEVSTNAMKALLGIDPPAGIQKALVAAGEWLRSEKTSRVKKAIAQLHVAYPDELSAVLIDVARSALPELIEDAHTELSQVIKAGLPERRCAISKVNEEQQYVLGIVLEPDSVDSQGDTYSAEEIEKTAHLYMIDYRNIKVQHERSVNQSVKVVESYLAPVDMEISGSFIKAGTWLMAVKIFDPEIWAKVKSGELSGFSIAGFATRTEIAA